MINVNIDTEKLINGLNTLEQKELPFAMSQSINKLANMAQDAERERMKQNFTLRHSDWVLKGIYISKAGRATKDDWSCTIEVEDKRSFLNNAEDGQDHTPITGRHYLTMPNKSVFPGIITRNNPLNIHNLELKPNSKGQVEGLNGTFMIRTMSGGLVLQRLADANYKNAGNIKRLRQMEKLNKHRNAATGNRILYTLLSRTRVPAKLHFIDTITKTVNDKFQSVFSDSLDKAIMSTINKK